jgi:hypothetical protein
MAYYRHINHELKLIVVFSPKCACQTIGWWFLNSLPTREQRHWRMLMRHRVNLEQFPDYPDYLKVFFIRDPLRRLVSFYAQWVIRNQELWCFADEAHRFGLANRSFRRFIFVLEHLSDNGMKLQHHLQPQLDGVPPEGFDRIILVERLDEGLSELNRELGIDADYSRLNSQRYSSRLQLPAADRSPAWFRKHGIPSAEWFFSGELLGICEEIYAQDFAFYRGSGGELLSPAGKT